jgi:hypothetical protein
VLGTLSSGLIFYWQKLLFSQDGLRRATAEGRRQDFDDSCMDASRFHLVSFINPSQFTHRVFTFQDPRWDRVPGGGPAMKHWLGWITDPTFHVVGAGAAVLGAALFGKVCGWGVPPGETVAHPAGCHACSVCPAEATAARDTFLIQTGSIEPDVAAE